MNFIQIFTYEAMPNYANYPQIQQKAPSYNPQFNGWDRPEDMPSYDNYHIPRRNNTHQMQINKQVNANIVNNLMNKPNSDKSFNNQNNNLKKNTPTNENITNPNERILNNNIPNSRVSKSQQKKEQVKPQKTQQTKIYIIIAQGEYKTMILPSFRVEIPTNSKYYHIAKLLLQGKILKLDQRQKQKWTGLGINTKIITQNNKKDSKIQKTVSILQNLGLDNDDKFEQQIRTQPQFLYNILKLWIEQAKAKKMANLVHKHYLSNKK